MTRVFISYRRADSAGHAGRLYDHLAQRISPADLFMDIDSIPPGEDFVSVLEKAVGGCDVVLVIVGPQWTSIADAQGKRRLDDPHDFVRLEIATALARGTKLIPVLVNGARMPGPVDLPDDLKPLARRNAIEISNERFRYDVDRLLRALLEEDSTPVPSPVVPPAPVAPPPQAAANTAAPMRKQASDLASRLAQRSKEEVGDFALTFLHIVKWVILVMIASNFIALERVFVGKTIEEPLLWVNWLAMPLALLVSAVVWPVQPWAAFPVSLMYLALNAGLTELLLDVDMNIAGVQGSAGWKFWLLWAFVVEIVSAVSWRALKRRRAG